MNRYLPLLMLLALSLAGCGGSESNSLSGSVKETFPMDFDHVEVYRQETAGTFVAMKVMYVDGQGSKKRYPVILIANAPVAENQPKNLKTEGNLYRTFDGSEFAPLKEGTITFEKLGKVGESVSGKFYATFTPGTTLNGDFSATLQLLSM
jgi:hypothetical protein